MSIFQTFYEGELTGLEVTCLKSFADHGHEVHLYTYGSTSVPEFCVPMNAEGILPASEMFRMPPESTHAGSIAPFADRFRYALLLKCGGWWVDTDVLCASSSWPREPIAFGREDVSSFNNAVLHFPPGHKLLRSALNKSRAAGENLKWGESGFTLLTKLSLDMGLQEFARPPEAFYPIHWSEWLKLMLPEERVSIEMRTTESFGVHLWNEMFRGGGVHTMLLPPEGSYLRAKVEEHGTEAAFWKTDERRILRQVHHLSELEKGRPENIKAALGEQAEGLRQKLAQMHRTKNDYWDPEITRLTGELEEVHRLRDEYWVPEIARLLQELDQRQEALEFNAQEVRRLSQELTEFNQLREEYYAPEIERLVREIGEARGELTELQRLRDEYYGPEVEHLASDLASIKEEHSAALADLHAELAETQSLLRRAEAAIQEQFRPEVDAAVAARRAAETRIQDELTPEIMRLRDQLECIERARDEDWKPEIERLTEEAEHARQLVSERSDQLTTLEAERNVLVSQQREQLSTLEAERDALVGEHADRLATLEAERGALVREQGDQLAILQAEHAALASEHMERLATVDAELQTAMAMVGKADDFREELERAHARALQASLAENTRLQRALQYARRDLADNQEQFRVHKEAQDASRARVSEMQSLIDTWFRPEILRLQDAIDSWFKPELTRLGEETEQAVQRKAAAEESAVGVQGELAMLRTEAAGLEHRRRRTQQTLEEEREGWAAAEAERRAEKDALTTQVTTLQTALSDLQRSRLFRMRQAYGRARGAPVLGALLGRRPTGRTAP